MPTSTVGGPASVNKATAMFKLTKVAKVGQVILTIDLAKCIQAATGLLVVMHKIGWL